MFKVVATPELAVRFQAGGQDMAQPGRGGERLIDVYDLSQCWGVQPGIIQPENALDGIGHDNTFIKSDMGEFF